MSERKLVVVIDDDRVNGEFLSYRLMRAGFTAYVFGEAPNCRDEVHNFGTPVAIILDVHLNKQSGLRLLANLRKDPRLDETKIIVLSHPRTRCEQRRCLKDGADLYIPKPFSVLNVLEQLEQMLTTPATS